MKKEMKISEMIDGLVDSGVCLEKVAEFVGIEMPRVVSLRGEEEGANVPTERELERVKNLFQREAIKGIYRLQPYLAQLKASEILGLPFEEFKSAYDGLVRSGAIIERRVKPEWARHEVLERNVI
jgi:hypothetical protein